MEPKNGANNNDEIKAQIMALEEVPDLLFPFFTAYKMYIDEQVRVYGFFRGNELIAVSAVIPDDPSRKDGFITYGLPIIYVFEVREDLRNKGIGKKCAEILVHDVIKEDSIQLSCTPYIAGFWEKLGFEIKFIDQTMYMHTMILEKENNLEKEKK
ncbi:MAG: GNAT family N-acetyltransferase [Candidatus Heimdallarchaeaceae archaeon]